MKYYTGIGSQQIPPDINEMMYMLGAILAKYEYVLRSGAAKGSDAAFEVGCDSAGGEKEIYLPWKNFNNHPSPLHHISPEAYEAAKQIFGSGLKYTKPYTKKFMSRNMYQVTGETLDVPSEFVVCWTPDGCFNKDGRSKKTGGTGQAIAYASSLGIPVFNLKNPSTEAEIINFLEKNK